MRLLAVAVAVRLLAVAVGVIVFLKASFYKRYLIVLELRSLPPEVFPGSHRVEDRVFQKSSIETTSGWGIRVRRNSRSVVQTVVLREQFAQHAETG